MGGLNTRLSMAIFTLRSVTLYITYSVTLVAGLMSCLAACCTDSLASELHNAKPAVAIQAPTRAPNAKAERKVGVRLPVPVILLLPEARSPVVWPRQKRIGIERMAWRACVHLYGEVTWTDAVDKGRVEPT